MASFAPVKGTRTQIQNTPIVDGQLLFETDQGDLNRIYLDVDSSTRRVIGGGGVNYLRQLSDVTLSQTISNNDVLKYNSSQSKWVNDKLVEWSTENTLSADDTSTTFTVATGDYAYDIYCKTALGTGMVKVRDVVISNDNPSTDTITVTFVPITSAQTGSTGQMCKMKLRIIRS